jgi:hypothetical protein
MGRRVLNAPGPSVAPSRDEVCALLWDCHLSGQMSEFQMQAHLRDDDYFRVFMENRFSERERDCLASRRGTFRPFLAPPSPVVAKY